MRQKLRIAVVILMALSIILLAVFSLYERKSGYVVDFSEIEGKGRSGYRAYIVRETDWPLFLIGAPTTLIIGGLVLYLLRESKEKD